MSDKPKQFGLSFDEMMELENAARDVSGYLVNRIDGWQGKYDTEKTLNMAFEMAVRVTTGVVVGSLSALGPARQREVLNVVSQRIRDYGEDLLDAAETGDIVEYDRDAPGGRRPEAKSTLPPGVTPFRSNTVGEA